MLLLSSWLPGSPPAPFIGPSDEAIEMSPPMLDESVEVSSGCRKLLLSSAVDWLSLGPPVLARADPTPPTVVVVPVPAPAFVVVVTIPGVMETENNGRAAAAAGGAIKLVLGVGTLVDGGWDSRATRSVLWDRAILPP